jgi:hypothetical protein
MDPFTIVLLAMLAFAVLLVAGVGRRPLPGAEPSPLLPRLVAGGAIVGAAMAALVSVRTIVETFVGDRVTLAVPVIASIDTVPAELRASTEAVVVTGATQQTTLQLTVSGLDTMTLSLVALQSVVNAAVVITVLIMIATLARQSLSETPFAVKLSALFVVSGGAIAIGATAAQLAGFLAGARAHEQLFFLSDNAIDGGVNVAPTWVIEVWPIGVGLVLIVIARLIRAGERIQSDTKGLV